MNLVKFKSRKPSKPYIKKGVEIQIYVEQLELKESHFELIEDVETEGVDFLVYDKLVIPWRAEFDQEAVYSEEGELVVESYINLNWRAIYEVTRNENG